MRGTTIELLHDSGFRFDKTALVLRPLFSDFVVPKGSSPHSQGPTTFPYSEPDQSSPLPPGVNPIAVDKYIYLSLLQLQNCPSIPFAFKHGTTLKLKPPILGL